MPYAETQTSQNARQKIGILRSRRYRAKPEAFIPSETRQADGDVKMTLDEQIESLEKMQRLIRKLAAEQGVDLKDDEDNDK